MSQREQRLEALVQISNLLVERPPSEVREHLSKLSLADLLWLRAAIDNAVYSVDEEKEDEGSLTVLLRDPESKAAAIENRFRRWLAAELDGARKNQRYSIRSLAHEMETSVSQVQRLLHREVGGSLTLRSIMRAMLALELGLDACVHSAAEREVAWGGQSCFRWPAFGHQPKNVGGRTLPPRRR